MASGRMSEAVPARDVPEEAGARLEGPRLGLTIDRNQAELRAVAEDPLVVVHQRPVDVAAHVDARVQAVVHSRERPPDVFDPPRVVVGADPVLGLEVAAAWAGLGVARAPAGAVETPSTNSRRVRDALALLSCGLLAAPC